MDVTVLENSEAVAIQAADLLTGLIESKPAAVLGLASGNTPLAMYKRLIERCQRGALSFREVSTFNLDEYLGLPPGDPQTYRAYMQSQFFEHIDINPNNTFLPECADGEDPLAIGPAYETLIRSRGGIDLQVLGIGRNGHIGFNEPTSSLNSRTRVKTLTRETVDANRQYFDDPGAQPLLAITMGIATVMDAQHLLLLATGEDKAEAVRQAIEGPVSAMCPASMLQMHQTATVLLDTAAASRLELLDYYHWVAEQKTALQCSREGS